MLDNEFSDRGTNSITDLRLADDSSSDSKEYFSRPVNTASAKPVPEGFSSVSEGSASIIHETGHVFYNPAQVQNRDLSIACLNVFSKIYRQEKEALAAKRSSRLVLAVGRGVVTVSYSYAF